MCSKYLDSNELRVRLAIVDCFLEISKGDNGLVLFQQAKEKVYASIVDNFERRHNHDHHDHHGEAGDHHKGEGAGKHHEAAPKPKEKKTDLVHDTEGFRCLETSMKILQNVLGGNGPRFSPHKDSELIGIVQRSLHHTNRYVRETGYFVCKDLFAFATPENLEREVGPKLGPELAFGLDDNWSEVRFAASVALRELFMKGDAFKARHYEVLVPRMLLNRYYAAQGVKTFSLDTWRLVIGEQGRQLVAQYIDKIVEYYISQIDSDNFGVREAAIHCMGELATRFSFCFPLFFFSFFFFSVV